MIPSLHEGAEQGDESEGLPSAEPLGGTIDASKHDPEFLGGLARACNMLIQAERLYEQQPTHQHELLLKTARRLLKSLQGEASRR